MGDLLEVFPNPNSGTFSLLFVQENNTPTHFMVQEVMGKTVFATEFSGEQTQRQINLGNDIGTGIYFVEIINGDTQYTKKINIIK
jgi:hypothetical protein